MDTSAKTIVRTATRSIMLAFALVAFAARAQDKEPPKPHVLVAFEIEAPKFLRNLPEQPVARREIAARIAEEFGRRYKFADWVTESAAAAGLPIGSLTLRLVELPATPGPEIVVKWFAQFGSGGTAKPLELALQPIQIYSPSNPDWESNNRVAFVSIVSQKVLPQVRTDGFQQQVLRDVVQKLSIASSVEMRSDDRVIVIPHMWRHLRLGQESTLVLVFSKRSGAAEERGLLQLSLPSPRARDPRIGWLQVAVNEAVFQTQKLPLTEGWNDTLPALLGGATISCFIRDYRPQDELAGSPLVTSTD